MPTPVVPIPAAPIPAATQPVASAPPLTGQQIPAPPAGRARPPLFGFRGRLARLRFLIRLCASLSVPLMALFFSPDWIHDAAEQRSAFQLTVIGAAALAIIIYQLSAVVLRLHDLGQRGWMAAGHFIPGFNVLLWLLLSIVPGQTDDNRYGTPPSGNSFLTWCAYFLFVLVPLGLAPAVALQYDAYLQARAAAQQ